MQVVSFTEARNNLKSIFDAVCLDYEEVVIHRKNGQNIAVIPFEEYSALKETKHLLSSKANKEHLLSSLEKARGGKSFPKELDE